MIFDDAVELILNSFNSDEGLFLNCYNNSYEIGCTSRVTCTDCELTNKCGQDGFEEFTIKLIKEHYPEEFI